jgi:uncharacterized protein
MNAEQDMTKAALLIVPGLGSSGPEHWQTLWQQRYPGSLRVEQRDWDRPNREEWIAALDHAVGQVEGPVILVAHSLACSLVAHWAGRRSVGKIAAALLVAPADVDSEAQTPPEVRCFALMPLEALPFPAVVAASADDPYVGIERAREFASRWGARFVDVGKLGHINSDSGHGEWAEGERIFAELRATVQG